MSARLLLTTALVSGVLFAGPASADQVVLKFWDNQQTESGLSQFQQEAVKRFEAENPDIKVEVTTIPYPEYQQRLLTAVQAGNGLTSRPSTRSGTRLSPRPARSRSSTMPSSRPTPSSPARGNP